MGCVPGCQVAESVSGFGAAGIVPGVFIVQGVAAGWFSLLLLLLLFVCNVLMLLFMLLVARFCFASYALAICHKPANWLVAQCVRTGSKGRASIGISSWLVGGCVVVSWDALYLVAASMKCRMNLVFRASSGVALFKNFCW